MIKILHYIQINDRSHSPGFCIHLLDSSHSCPSLLDRCNFKFLLHFSSSLYLRHNPLNIITLHSQLTSNTSWVPLQHVPTKLLEEHTFHTQRIKESLWQRGEEGGVCLPTMGANRLWYRCRGLASEPSWKSSICTYKDTEPFPCPTLQWRVFSPPTKRGRRKTWWNEKRGHGVRM